MTKIIILQIVAILFLLSANAANSLAQETAEQTLKLSTDLVTFDAQVLTKKTGRPVGNLSKEDFSLFEDGVRQDITHFSQDRLPLSVLLLIDTSGSVWDFMSDVRDRTIVALNQLKESDEVAVMGTASKTAVIQNFTKDRALIADKIAGIEEKSLGSDGILLHEALFQAATHLQKAANPASRRVIIVVTDNISTQKIGQGHSEREALDELFEAGSVVCGLNISNLNATVLRLDPFYYAVKGLLFRGDINTYAEKTGGIILKTKKDNVESRLAELISQLRTRYAIGYVSSNTSKNGKYRKIKLGLSQEVEKREGKLDIIARRGYYARKNQASTNEEKTDNQSKPVKSPEK
jgi:Ca-activated chloride channel homolog